MAKAATAFVDFEGDFSKIQRATGNQAKGIEKSFKSSFGRIATFAAASLAAIGIGKILGDAFKEASDAQKVGKQTAAVIKSTGGLARVSAKDVDKLSNSLSNVAGVDDELIASGENVLLTFTKVRNEVGKGNNIFDQATEAALNMSSALGGDLQGSVIQIGKALNDPIKGVTALAKVGVSFTKQQREQIKTLVESGHALDAQKLILKELTTEFGGAAAAAATPAAKLSVAFKNIEESLGGLLLPLFEKVAAFLSRSVVPAIENTIPVLQQLGSLIVIAFKVGFGGSTKPIHGWLKIFAEVGLALRKFAEFVRDVVVPQLIRLGDFFARNWHTIRDIGVGVINALVTAFNILLPVIVNLGRGIAAFIGFLRQNQDVALALAAVIGTLVAAFITMQIIEGIRALVMSFRLAMVALNSSFLANPIVLVAAALVALVAGVILAYRHFKIFHDAVDTAWQILQTTFHWVQHNWPLLLAILTGPFGLAVRFIIQHWSGILSFFKGIPAAIGGFLKTVATTVTAPFRTAFNAIAKLWNNTVGKLSFKIPSWVPGIGGKGFSVPKIPTLHTGGVFDAAGGQGLALLKSGEGVFTPAQMKAMGSSGPSVVTNVWGNVYGDSHLRKIFDDHDQKLVSQLAVGHR